VRPLVLEECEGRSIRPPFASERVQAGPGVNPSEGKRGRVDGMTPLARLPCLRDSSRRSSGRCQCWGQARQPLRRPPEESGPPFYRLRADPPVAAPDVPTSIPPIERVANPATRTQQRFTDVGCGVQSTVPGGGRPGYAVSWERKYAIQRYAPGNGSTSGLFSNSPNRRTERGKLLTHWLLSAQNRAPCGQIGGTGWKYASTSF
jgi:hypothetical protein